MIRNTLLLILISISFSSFGQISNHKAIDAIFSDWDKPNVPGCALGIIQDGEMAYAKGYGMANIEYDIPNSASSVFRIGSTSKQFTAACIILLAEQGKLKLDDNLKSFYPEFPAYAEKITVRHLLNHTSGIRDYLMISYLKALGNDAFYTDSDVMKWLINQADLNFNPGEEFLYSNSGYWLLGQIVQKASGMNMADYAQKEIFEPLAMNDTHFHNDHTQIVKNRASGYALKDYNTYRISMTTLDMIGDGGIFTTIDDIKKWDDAFYNSDVLSMNFWTMMTQQGVLNNGKEIDYASGLMIGEYKGMKTIRHGGAFVGFRAELLRFPDQRLSIAIFANRADADPSGMANKVADVILKGSFKNTNPAAQNEVAETKTDVFIELSTSELEKVAGNYWNESDAYARKIYVKNDTLRYYRNEFSESPLLPISSNEFKMINVNADLLIRFKNNGKRTMEVSVNGDKPSLFNEYQPKEYRSEELADFEGTYFSKELDVSYTLKIEEEMLTLYIHGSKKSPLKSIKKNLFTNQGYGTFEFTEAGDGNISGFTLAAGRVKNLKFEKK